MRFLRILAAGILLSFFALSGAQAQQVNMYWCTSTTVPCPPSGWVATSTSNPMPITGALSIAGTTSNASSGVATSSTNLPTVSYNYGFNGTTWDQLQVDGSKNLKVNVVTGGGGGVADETAFAYGTSTYSPIGGVYNSSITALTSGQGGAAALTAARAVNIDAVAGSNLANLAAAPEPCKAGTAPSTQTAVGSGATTAVQCDLNGNTYISPQQAGGVPLGQAAMAASAPVVVASNQSSIPVTPLSTTNAGLAGVKGGVGVVNGASNYQAEPASTSITALTGGSGGAAGDYLSHCTVIPTTVSPGVFTITDNATAIYSFPGGASSLSNLVPWTVPVGAVSSSGAWKVTTGAGLSIVCVGKFT